MSKQRVTLTIDNDVYLRAKQTKDNLSEIVSKLLRQYYGETLIDKEEQEILCELQKINQIVSEAQERSTKLSVMLIQLREQHQQTEKEEAEEADRMYKAGRAISIAERVFHD